MWTWLMIPMEMVVGFSSIRLLCPLGIFEFCTHVITHSVYACMWGSKWILILGEMLKIIGWTPNVLDIFLEFYSVEWCLTLKWKLVGCKYLIHCTTKLCEDNLQYTNFPSYTYKQILLGLLFFFFFFFTYITHH